MFRLLTIFAFIGLSSVLVLTKLFGVNKRNEPIPQKPNIIFIISDDHAYQAIGAYGNKIAQTPNIDRLVKEGAILNNQLVTNSICGPSRACFLTGKYSHINGYKSNDGKFDVKQQMLSGLLSQEGYQTAWIGKWHLGTLPGKAFDHWEIMPDQGFYYNPDFINQQNDTVRSVGYVTDIITQKATDWLESRDKSKPFFLVVGEKATHREWLPDVQDLGAYDHVNFPLPATFFDDYSGREAAKEQYMSIAKAMELDRDLKVNVDFNNFLLYKRMNKAQREAFSNYYLQKVTKDFEAKKPSGKDLAVWKYQRYMKDYYATANSLDRNIGKMLDYLDKKQLSQNTIVIYASDQGFYLGEHGWFDKRFMYEESLKTPFVIRYPGKIKAGSKINNIVANIDWAPTLLDMAGGKIPVDIQGRSFWSALNGSKAGLPERPVYYHYYEYPGPHLVHPHFGIRTSQYKLIRFYGKLNSWELYDLKKDTHELHNLIADKRYAQLLKSLKSTLLKSAQLYQDQEAVKYLTLQAPE
ncbi:sulfatase [Pedobacter frigoris]|uniref:sulfatase family protein n=1 Tax=Pedobacter frigoris TaxID=2571272 RepID=UPI00292D3B4E|nr:sulfatase [Pedobacter frigoris]